MTTLYTEDGDPVEIDDETPNLKQQRDRIKALEAQVAEKEQLEAKVRQFEQSEAMRGAGLELDEVRRRAFEAAHQGAWDAEAVRATAVQLGWAAPPDPAVPNEEIAGHQRLQAAFTGGTTTPPDPEQELDAKLAGASNQDEFMAMYRESGRPISA